MLPRQRGIAFRHLVIRVAQDLLQFLKIAAVHHVPSCKSVTEIIEEEVFDPGFKQPTVFCRLRDYSRALALLGAIAALFIHDGEGNGAEDRS